MTVRRGDVWDTDFDPIRGREQGGIRPALVISTDLLHVTPSDLAMVLPITSRDRRIRTHVPIGPPEGGVVVQSFILCEQLRSVSWERLLSHRGRVHAATLAEVALRLRLLLDLP